MTVSGDDAKGFNAVRLDSYANVNTGELVEANDATGLVRWKDKAGVVKSITLGEHAIRIMARAR